MRIEKKRKSAWNTCLENGQNVAMDARTVSCIGFRGNTKRSRRFNVLIQATKHGISLCIKEAYTIKRHIFSYKFGLRR